MAFFGLTRLGYQNPIGDKLIVNPNEASHSQDGLINIGAPLTPLLEEQQTPHRSVDICSVCLQPIPHSDDIHQGSHERYKEMVKRVLTPRSPNQVYTMPLTDNQQYGWMMPKSPEPWTHVKRFPQKDSEMTKFVNATSLTAREASLF